MIVLVRGAGDLASGVAYRLFRAGIRVAMTELAQPLAVRRLVCFAEAIYAGAATVEGISAQRVKDPADSLRILQIMSKGQIPVLIDPQGEAARTLYPAVIVDARMTKLPPEQVRHTAKLYIGLGPGFTAGQDCHAVIETQRGHYLGRVIWSGSSQADTGYPEAVGNRSQERVLRSPGDGLFTGLAEIGQTVESGQVIAQVSGQAITAPFRGMLRGLLHDGVEAQIGLKVGDLDPRDDRSICSSVSDKALAVGGGVLEAILSRPELRTQMWA
jgi:xanthine dehydrogenase accessory factor